VSAVAAAVAKLSADIAKLSPRIGRRVVIDGRQALNRRGHLPLQSPGIWSPNRACRLVQAADGWIAVNLARPDDRALLPAWLQADVDEDPWPAVIAAARRRPWRDLIAGARLFGLPAAGVGETAGAPLEAPRVRLAPGRPGARASLTVVDLSAMWAGPLCGAILAATGARVVKIESTRRPDPVRHATPGLYERLNGAKTERALDFADPAAIGALREEILAADVVITGARPRAFEQLGLTPASIFPGNPGLVWVAISGHGWLGEGADRVAFGDDAAAAGGLVRWTPAGAPRFLGDALADPVTGLSAAAGALAALCEGGGLIVDAALARCAAGAAAMRAEPAAA
jgi:hypothetical protein